MSKPFRLIDFQSAPRIVTRSGPTRLKFRSVRMLLSLHATASRQDNHLKQTVRSS